MFQRGLHAFAVLLIAIVPALAQDTATLTGTVTDSTGAVVANAKVTATNVATNFDTDTTTNTEGLYRLPFLRPGDYRVRVQAPGFKTSSAKTWSCASARPCRSTP